MTYEEFVQKLRTLLDEYGKSEHKDGAMCTTFFLTAEFFDGSGQYFASTFFNQDDTPVWRITGLVQHALENDFTTAEEE
jgi:hypothetical protein